MTAARKMPTPTAVPDPESRPRPKRRTFTKEYKLGILVEADRCGGRIGEIGALLRREGLYSGALSTWRKERAAGTLGAVASKKRGPKADPQRAELEQLRRKLERAEKRLEVAEQVIDAQKKLCVLLGLPAAKEDENSA